MSSAAVRLQLPAGEPYAPAFTEAAAKYGARRGFADTGVLFCELMELTLECVRSTEPVSMVFTATESASAVTAEVTALEPTQSIDTKRAVKLADLGDSCETLSVADTSIRFVLAID